MSFPAYYTPFTTSNETIPGDDSDSDNSDSGSENGFTDSTAQGLDDPRYAIIRAAGPSFNTFPMQSFYHMGLGSPYNQEDIYDPSTNIPLRLPFLPFTPATKSTSTSLFSFSSSQRDTAVFPHSTYFTIRTPRVYKNITQIQFCSINFPVFTNAVSDASALKVEIARYVSSNTNFTFSNCYACIGNTGGGGRGLTTSLNGGSFSEAGRVNPVATSKPLTHTFSVRGGAYDPGSMVNEMDKQLNSTPPFNIISYQEHRQLFITNGTADHLFNDPGKWYFSPSSSTYIRNASKSLIMRDYLPSTTLTTLQPTEREIFVAYFFPVLRAALFSTYDNKFLSFGAELLHRPYELAASNRLIREGNLFHAAVRELENTSRECRKGLGAIAILFGRIAEETGGAIPICLIILCSAVIGRFTKNGLGHRKFLHKVGSGLL